ncbi:MAG: dienelactone hydrolase family protein [Allosphingosinicella sp.]
MSFPTPVGTARGYLARPRQRGRHPAVLVLHAELGVPHWTKAVADELAGAGFVALTVACFSRIPGLTEEQLRADGQGRDAIFRRPSSRRCRRSRSVPLPIFAIRPRSVEDRSESSAFAAVG